MHPSFSRQANGKNEPLQRLKKSMPSWVDDAHVVWKMPILEIVGQIRCPSTWHQRFLTLIETIVLSQAPCWCIYIYIRMLLSCAQRVECGLLPQDDQLIGKAVEHLNPSWELSMEQTKLFLLRIASSLGLSASLMWVQFARWKSALADIQKLENHNLLEPAFFTMDDSTAQGWSIHQ